MANTTTHNHRGWWTNLHQEFVWRGKVNWQSAVAGAVAAIQSIAKGVYGITLTAREMRNIIRIEGTPQSAELNHSIGWLLNIFKAGQVGIPRIMAIRKERTAAVVPPIFFRENISRRL
jgi:hypothetical protein